MFVRIAHAELQESVMRVVRFSAPLELVNIAVLGAHRVRIRNLVIVTDTDVRSGDAQPVAF